MKLTDGTSTLDRLCSIESDPNGSKFMLSAWLRSSHATYISYHSAFCELCWNTEHNRSLFALYAVIVYTSSSGMKRPATCSYASSGSTNDPKGAIARR